MSISSTISLTSFGIRLTDSDRAAGYIRTHYKFLFQNIEEHKFGDIVNFQAVPQEAIERLKKIQGYYVIVQPYRKNRSLAILLRKDRFTPKEQKIVLGNENISLLQKVIEAGTGKTMMVFNCHIHKKLENAAPQVTELLEALKSSEMVIGSGNFNTVLEKTQAQEMVKAGGFVIDPSPADTVTKENKKLDYIFVKNMKFEKAGNQGVSDIAKSKHNPLLAKIQFIETKAPSEKKEPAAAQAPTVEPAKRKWSFWDYIWAPLRWLSLLFKLFI